MKKSLPVSLWPTTSFVSENVFMMSSRSIPAVNLFSVLNIKTNSIGPFLIFGQFSLFLNAKTNLVLIESNKIFQCIKKLMKTTDNDIAGTGR